MLLLRFLFLVLCLFVVLVIRSCTLLLFGDLGSLLLFFVLVLNSSFVVPVICHVFVSLLLFVFFVRVLRVRVIVLAIVPSLCDCYCSC